MAANVRDLGRYSVKEKDAEAAVTPVPVDNDFAAGHHSRVFGKLEYYVRKLDSYGLEARGIERVKSEERQPQNWFALSLLWSSAGLTLSSYSTGFLGVEVYNLSFPQAAGIIWSVGALGAMCSAYMAIFGKRNGLRALTSSRFAFGWYGAMVMALFNVFTEVSYGIIDCILGGQALRTVSKGKLPLPIGIIVISAISWIIAIGGYKFIHAYSRFAFIVPMISFIAMYAVFGDEFTSSPVPVPDNYEAHAGKVLSYIAVIFGSYAGWTPVSGDYYIYFPENTPDWKVFCMSFLGIWFIPSFATTCGAAFASTTLYKAEWAAAYTGSDTDFIDQALNDLGNARYFFIFLLGWSLISNNIFNLYSIGLSAQLFGKWAIKVPRFIWTLCASILITILSVVGRNSFSAVLLNLLALIGYWSMIYFGIFGLEFALIRPKFGLDLSAWNDRTKLPPGYAAGFAFGFGVMGAVLGMNQTWYQGKIGAHIGEWGGDLGIELGFGFAIVTYPFLRYVEFKKFGR